LHREHHLIEPSACLLTAEMLQSSSEYENLIGMDSTEILGTASDAELADALLAWLDEAIAALRADFDDLIHLVGMPKWLSASDGSFQLHPCIAMYHHSKLDAVIFSNSSRWPAAEAVAARHFELVRHCDTLVGSANGSARFFTLKDLCRKLIPEPRLTENQTAVAVIPNDIRDIVQDFIKNINSATLLSKTVWPIVGMATQEPIELEDGVTFREFSVEEKINLLNFGLMQSDFGQVIASENARWFGLCREVSEGKRLGPISDDLTEFTLREEALEQLLEDFLTIVPLATEKVAYHGGGFRGAPRYDSGGIFATGLIGRGFGGSNIRFMVAGESMTVTEFEREKIKEIWAFIRNKKNGKFRHRVLNACRRLFYAETRLKPEDALLDMVIAAESLYLDESAQGELTFRMSLNAALWSQGSNADKRDVNQDFKDAYRLRSKIVHGSTASSSDITAINQKIKPILKAAIGRAVGELVHSETSPAWLEMVLPED
jgi:Apea-like HEPN